MCNPNLSVSQTFVQRKKVILEIRKMNTLNNEAMDEWKVEAVAQRCSLKNVFLEISQIYRKTPVPQFLFK